MTPIFGHDDAIAEIVGKLLGQTIHPPYTAIGFTDHQGNLCGGAVFNSYNGSNIDLTVYLPRTDRAAIKVIVAYVFVQLECNRLTARTKTTNVRAKKALEKIGFKFEAVLKNWFGPGKQNSGVMYRLDKQTALERWLPNGRA